jgi:tRNA(Ile)-lysidine synthase
MSRRPGEAPPPALSALSPEEAAEDFLKRLPASCRLLVALSGGGDSMGLLAVLSNAARAFPGISLHSATVDHGLRPGSAEEADTVRRMSRKLGIANSTLTWTGGKPATGIQAAARSARYRLLAAEADRIRADFIVTGHSLDDQDETIFMRGLRKPVGVTGMDEAVLVERRNWVVRPFLVVRREAIRDYLRKRCLTWIEDPSNDNPAFERVRIRRSGMATTIPAAVEYKPNPYLLSAQYVRDHVRVHSSLVAVADLRECHVYFHAYWSALVYLAACIGGRVHGPGGEAEGVLRNRLAKAGDFRMTAGRVLFDRRGHSLYMYREGRGLGAVSIGPGSSACWDGRYEIENAGDVAVTVGAGGAPAGAGPLLRSIEDAGLPDDVKRRVAMSAPRLLEGGRENVKCHAVLAPFDKFLPSAKLDLANSLATAFELEQFPLLSLGNGAF